MPNRRATAAEAAPYFFLSHAVRQGVTPTEEFRRDRLVQRFHQDLEESVRELVNDRGRAIAAVDSEFPVDGRWSERVSRGLARCRVFVPLYSDEYFSSEHCGREWQAFANRLGSDAVLPGRRPEAVVPVLWQPMREDALPESARRTRRSWADAGPTYLRYGLSYLIRHLPEHRDEYDRVLLQAARRIVDAAENGSPTTAEQYPDYQSLADAFQSRDDPSHRARIRIVIAAPTLPQLPRGADAAMYGQQPTDWKPYLPDHPGAIAMTARRVAESMDFQTVVEILERSEELRSGTAPSAPTLLIIDPWAAQVPALQRRLNSFDSGSHLKLWVRPVVAWNREHPSAKDYAAYLDDRLQVTLPQCRRRYRPDAPQVLDGLETMHEFLGQLPTVIRTAERRYFSEIGRELSERTEPAEQPRRPRFSGPGPGFGTGGVDRLPDTEV